MLATRTLSQEPYTPFIVDNNKISSVPEEILVEIFQFSSSTPFDIVNISHVCVSWGKIVNDQYRVWQFVPLVLSKNTSLKRSELGHLLLKYFNRSSPVYFNSKYRDDYKRFDEQYERYLKQKVYYNLIQESDVPKLMKAFKKPIVVCKEQFLDLLVHVKKEKQQAQTLRRRREYLDTLTSKSETVIIHSLFFVFNFLALGMVGSLEMLRRTPVEERTMDKGLWWLPYATYPWYSIFALSGLFCLGAGINEFYKFKSRSETIAVGIAFTIWSLILWIFTGFKYRMYSLAGMELSYWQDKIFPRSNIFLCFPFYAIGAFADAIIYSEYVHQHMYRKSTFPYFGCNINWGNLDKERATVFSCFSLCLTSLGLFSFTNLAPVFSFLPMVTAGAVAGSYMLSRYSDTDTRVVAGLPFGAALSLGILSLEHYSGLTFAPVATALLVMSGYFGYKHWFGKYY